MSWRPEGWKNPYGLSDKVYAPELQLIEKSIHDAYEAGADAMKEARDKAIAEALKNWIAGKGTLSWVCEHLEMNYHEVQSLYLDLKERIEAEFKEQP